MARLMDLKVDFAFKQLFGKPGNEELLRAFLNAALKHSAEKQIASVEILSPELLREHLEDKASVLDIYAKTEQGEHINIEIQLANKFDMEKRTLYYWSRLYTTQMQKGQPYTELARTVTINILNFHFLTQTEKYHSTFHLYEDEEWFPLTDVLEIHFMELPKLMAQWERRTVSPHTNELAKWLLLLEADEHAEIRKELEVIAMKDPVMKQAFEAWEHLSRDPKKWVEYESRLKAILDESAFAKEMEIRQQRAEQQAREKGLAEGLAKGRAEGRAEGLAEGRAEGLAEGERQKAIEVARNLLAMDMPVDVVVKATGLPAEQVEALKKQLH